jgi:hypothetical protein
MLLASIESLLGSIWFAALACVVGYVGGQVFPISKIKSLISKRTNY